MNNTNVKFYWAEVIDTTDSYTYNNSDTENANNEYLYTIKVQLYDTDIESYPLVAKPYNLNNVQVPVKGEHVLIFEAISPRNSEQFDRTTQWYYLPAISINSNINQNVFPGISVDNTADESIQKTISPTQIYKGDNVISGRFGNTIRLGSTPDKNQSYYKAVPWKGTSNDPIVVISNSKKNFAENELNTNDINKDYSSLYLTSTQEISGYTVTKSLKQENGYQSQFIGVADRINLNAKTDSVTINAPNNIELNTDKVVFGTDINKENGIYSTELHNVLNNILNVLTSGFKSADNTLITSAVDQISLLEASGKLNNILNPKIQQDKRTE
jgi:hypothetical protein